jgi:hypothetical protein
MNGDRIAKHYAGQRGICAVLVNVIVDKAVISQSELRERFNQSMVHRIGGCSHRAVRPRPPRVSTAEIGV